MYLKNTQDPIAIPSFGIGLLESDQVFAVSDEVGARLLTLARFVEVEEDGTPKPLLDLDIPANPQPGTIDDPAAYQAAIDAGITGPIADETEPEPPAISVQNADSDPVVGQEAASASESEQETAAVPDTESETT